MEVLGNPLRWELVHLLAGRGAMSAIDCARALQQDFDTVRKQLRVLRNCAVVAGEPGEDRRYMVYRVPDHFRAPNGDLDFGSCVVRIRR